MSSLTDWLRLEKEGEDARGAQEETEPASEGFDLGRYVDSLLEPELSNASLPALQRRLHEALAELQKQKAAAQSELSDARIHADDAANKRAERAHALSEEVSNLLGRFGALDQHIADLSRSSAHVGDRLHSAQHQRQRSEQISHDILHLQRFASFDGSLSSLSHPFNDPSLLTDSALPARRLLDIARDINRSAISPFSSSRFMLFSDAHLSSLQQRQPAPHPLRRIKPRKILRAGGEPAARALFLLRTPR